MRGRILEILRAGGQEPVSGEELSRQLDVSRTAVWKHIQALKAEGYDIESVPKKGYVLKSAPDRLKPAEIITHLKTNGLGTAFITAKAWILPIMLPNAWRKKAATTGLLL